MDRLSHKIIKNPSLEPFSDFKRKNSSHTSELTKHETSTEYALLYNEIKTARESAQFGNRRITKRAGAGNNAGAIN
jgi:hypothetical protein